MTDKKAPRGSSAVLAGLLSITDRRVRQLAEAGTITRQPEGDFILPDAIEQFYVFKFVSDEELDYSAEKARHEKVKRELSELELAQRRGQLHTSEDVEFVMTDMLSNLRAQLLALPSKMAPALANRDREYIYSELEREIKDRLTELSDYSPALFMKDSGDGTKDD